MPTSDFKTPIDIANRGLQHMGASRIVTFEDDNKTAAEVSFVYDKLRQAELRRNVWRFATRIAVLRPIDTTTKLLAPEAWDDATTYDAGAVVSFSGEMWQTEVETTGEEPGTTTAPWNIYFGPLTVTEFDTTLTYYVGEVIYYTDLHTYLSLLSANDELPGAGDQWLDLGLTADVTAALTILWPVGSGPFNQSSSRNVFRLPNGWLREAPQDPKAGNIGYLGAPSGLTQNDWTYAGNYFTSRQTNLVVYRFVADITGVLNMDPMFCEGLAARIGLELCETITQSGEKLSNIGAQYKLFMSEARIVNGIETGPTEPPEDEYISCRV